VKGRCPGCGTFHEVEDDLFARFEEIRCVCGRVFKADEMAGRPSGPTLEEARRALLAEIREGTVCPCCERIAKVYKRKLNSSMARTMITFYRHSRKKPGWFHVLREFVFEKAGPRYVCGDYSKLIYWGLIEERGDQQEDGNPHSGYFRITQRGVDFVEGRVRIARFVFLYNDRQVDVGEDPGDTDVHEALGDKFDYNELMRA